MELETRSHHSGRVSHQGSLPSRPQDFYPDDKSETELSYHSDPRSPPYVPPPPERQPLPAESTHENHHCTEAELSDKEEAKQRINNNIAFACFVFWCCNVYFGTIAFFLAIFNRDATAKEARRLGNITLVISVVGIVVSWLLVAVVLALWYNGILPISFAPWRISHYYPEDKDV